MYMYKSSEKNEKVKVKMGTTRFFKEKGTFVFKTRMFTSAYRMIFRIFFTPFSISIIGCIVLCFLLFHLSVLFLHICTY